MCVGMCMHIFVCVYVYVIWGLLIFLNLFTCAIHYNWKVCRFSSSVIHCLWDSSDILDLLMLSHRFLRLFSFFPLIFYFFSSRLDNCYLSIYKITNIFLYHLHSSVSKVSLVEFFNRIWEFPLAGYFLSGIPLLLSRDFGLYLWFSWPEGWQVTATVACPFPMPQLPRPRKCKIHSSVVLSSKF